MRILWVASSSFLLLALSTGVGADQPPVSPSMKVSPTRLVAADSNDRLLVEPHLAIDPNNPQHWLVGVIVASPDSETSDCASLVSFDGGQTWMRHDLGVKTCGDPWTGILPNGTALLAVIANEDGELLWYRSEDGGRDWHDPVALGNPADHATFIVAPRGSKWAGDIFLVAEQGAAEPASGKVRSMLFIARSSDGGKSFEKPSRLFPSNLYLNSMNPALLSDGMLLVPYSDFARNAIAGAGFLWLDRGRDWLLRSPDGGHTFVVPTLMSESCFKTFGQLAVDPSDGPFRDRVYWLCNDGTHENIYLHYSPDGGEHWSKPVRVNQNSSTTPDVRNAVMTVNRQGVIGISWYDARGDKRFNRDFLRCQELYFSASLDGGQTFLPEVRVGEKSCPLSPRNGEAGIRFITGGDYDGIVATADGRFHLVWSDSRDGIYKLWTASVTLNGELPARRP